MSTRTCVHRGTAHATQPATQSGTGRCASLPRDRRGDVGTALHDLNNQLMVTVSKAFLLADDLPIGAERDAATELHRSVSHAILLARRLAAALEPAR